MRNPLSTALWSAELLGRLAPEERAGARGDKLSSMCLRTLVRLRHLVEDFFLVERLAIGGIPLRAEPLSAAELLRVAGRRAGVACEQEFPGIVVYCDRATTERAVEAVLAAAGREGGAVTVGASSLDGSVLLHFTGTSPPGDPFRAPDRSTLSDPTGRALALLAARAVAEANGGSLAVEEGAYVLRMPEGELPVAGEER